MRAVLERDFLAEASRPRAFAVRCMLAVLVAAPILLVLTLLAGDPRVPADTYGAFLFRAGGGAWLALLVVATPPLVVGAVLAERQNETLGLVLAAPVTPLQFAAAKLASRSGAVLLVAMAAFPCLALTTLFGGVGGGQVLGLAMVALGVVLEMAATALWMSAAYRKFALALLVSYLIPILRWIACAAVSVALTRRTWSPRTGRAIGAPDQALAGLLFETSPLPAADQVLSLGAFVRWPLSAIPSWLPFLAWAALTAVVALVAARWWLVRESEPGTPAVTARRGFLRRRFRGSPGKGNPLVWKETRLLNSAGSRGLQYRILCIMLAIETLGIATLLSAREAILVFCVHLSLICIVAVVQGAAALGHERTQGSWDLLRVSRLGPGALLLGKAAGVGVGLLLLATVPAVHVVIGWILGTFSLQAAILALALLGIVPGAWAAVGLSCGIREPTPARAMARAAALLAVAGIGFPLLGGVASALLDAAGYYRNLDLEWFLLCGSPPAAAYDMLFRLHWDHRAYFRHSAAVAPLWIGGTAFYLLLQGLLLPWLLRNRLRREREEG
jgi:hypothetical protein